MVRVEDIATHPEFERVDHIAGIDVDLRYVGADNFAGRSLYGSLDCRWLAERQPGWRIRLLDALRPQRVQEAIWADVEGTPAQTYFANPGPGSIHSWGLAVDVTLLDARGQEVDMGSGFDEMHERSHPEFHARLLASGALQLQQVQRRELLAAAMAAGGFAGIPNEWWHFDHGERALTRATLARVY
jgi:zinc D-Ala-D-Ala dipeptidase